MDTPKPFDENIPYEILYGDPSYEVCPCCGYEFGNDDCPGTTAGGDSFTKYRNEWIKCGMQWWDEKSKPNKYNPSLQLRNLGIDLNGKRGLTGR